MDETMIDLATPSYWKIAKELFSGLPMFMGVRYSGIDGVLYPRDFAPGLDNASSAGETPWDIIPEDELPVIPPIPGFAVDVIVGPDVVSQNPPAYHPVRKDTAYVFSMNFYNETPGGQSAMELLVRRALRHETIDAKWVLHLCKTAKQWEPIDRFFLTPVLLFLIKAAQARF